MMVYEIHGPFFFGAVETFERTMKDVQANVRILFLRLKDVPFIDATGLQALRKTIRVCLGRNVKIILCEAEEKVGKKISRANVEDALQNRALGQTFRSSVDLVRSSDLGKELLEKSSPLKKIDENPSVS
jgi:SulP family sulfate permease